MTFLISLMILSASTAKAADVVRGDLAAAVIEAEHDRAKATAKMYGTEAPVKDVHGLTIVVLND